VDTRQPHIPKNHTASIEFHPSATPGSNGAPAQQGQLPYGKPREHQHHLMREMAGLVDETMVKQ